MADLYKVNEGEAFVLVEDRRGARGPRPMLAITTQDTSFPTLCAIRKARTLNYLRGTTQ